MQRAVLAILLLSGCTVLQPNADFVGGDGETLIRTAGTLVIELDVPPNQRLHNDSLLGARQVLEEALRRSVEFRQAEEPELQGGATTPYSPERLRQLHDSLRDEPPEPGRNLHIVVVPGKIVAEGKDAIGLAFSRDGAALAGGSIRANTCEPGDTLCRVANGKPERPFVERAVLVHEIGHLLGLVNMGTPMAEAHEDRQQPGHSNNPESVMWWQVETVSGILGLFEDGRSIPHRFDSNDLADIAAVRNRP